MDARNENGNLMKTALELDHVCSNYKIQFDAMQAAEFVRKADHGNAGQDDVIKLVDKVNQTIPPMSYPRKRFEPPNPNNGRPHHIFEIGNECSRVVYVRVITAYLADGYDRQALAKRLCTLGKQAHADEVNLWDIDKGSFTIRYWWD